MSVVGKNTFTSFVNMSQGKPSPNIANYLLEIRNITYCCNPLKICPSQSTTKVGVNKDSLVLHETKPQLSSMQGTITPNGRRGTIFRSCVIGHQEVFSLLTMKLIK